MSRSLAAVAGATAIVLVVKLIQNSLVQRLPDPVTAKKDDASADVQAAIVNVAGLNSSSAGGGLIQTTSG